jgi:hypothetical protein
MIQTEKQHEVLNISIGGQHIQYLKKSESRFIANICKDKGAAVTVELKKIPHIAYKTIFG